jgi:phage terminase large subunit-like protein
LGAESAPYFEALVASSWRTIDSITTERADKGDWRGVRAMLYQQGRVKHVDPPLLALEDEMCDFGMASLASGASPDRLDALVWAVTELTARTARGEPRVRGL